MLYLLPLLLLFTVSFGDDCNSITYTDSTGKRYSTPTGNIDIQVIIYIYIYIPYDNIKFI